MSEAVHVLALIGVLALTVYFLLRGDTLLPSPRPVSKLIGIAPMGIQSPELCGPPSQDRFPVVVEMLYSDDKRPWVEYAADRFAHLCPNIQVKLAAMSDLEAARAIAAGDAKPTLWAPTDDLLLEYLAQLRQPKAGEVLFDRADRASLVRSPLVLLVWKDRASVLEEILRASAGSERPGMAAVCALVPKEPAPVEAAIEGLVPGRWIDWYGARGALAPGRPAAATKPAVAQEELRRWGRVKFAHTPPTASSSGLEALYLMAYDHVVPPEERAALAGDAAGAFERGWATRKAALQQWLRRCQAGLDATPRSTELLTETMFRLGPSRYDGVVTYEHFSFSVLDQIDDHASDLPVTQVLYPQPTFANQHPVVLLEPQDPARKAQHEAARRWIGFLRSREMQEKAIEYGFRPASPEVSVRTYDVGRNPFLHLRRYGISLDPELTEPPRLDGSAIQELIRLWEDATGRN